MAGVQQARGSLVQGELGERKRGAKRGYLLEAAV